MSTRVVIPQVGQSIAEATILKWFKKAGEHIEKGETLVEIGTDKVNTEIPAPESGIVQSILIPEGETVPVLTEIAVISDGKAETQTSSSTERPSVPVATATISPKVETDRHYSPVVRRLAQEHNVELAQIHGTGTEGRITKEDVLKYVEERNQSKPATLSDEERVPMTRMRKLIAEHMSLSRRTAADVTTFFEIDMSAVVRERENLAKSGTKLTYLPFVVKAVAQGVQAFPVLNSSIEKDAIVYKKHCNIGVAVALEDGLIVPVLKNAETLSVAEIAQKLQDLSDRARSSKLLASELEGGTFTITNPGVFGALLGTPIIHQPQVAILGIGAVVKRAVVIQDEITIRPMCYLSLSYDHRALDGATADRFLSFLKNALENQTT